MVSFYNERIEICKKCDSYNHITSQCKECGCFMILKAKLKNSSCPLKKWSRKARNMAYFAELDFDNVVKQIVVVNDDVIGENVFPESEKIGQDFLKSLYGQHTVWKQTSPNGEYRKGYAHMSGIYNPTLDVFLEKKPYNSWILNPQSLQWEAPLPMPNEDHSYEWDEISLSWKKTNSKPD